MIDQQLVRKIRGMHLGKRFRVPTQVESGYSSRFRNGKWCAFGEYNRPIAQISPVDDVGIGQLKRHRTQPQSHKPDSDCGKHGRTEMQIEPVAEALATYRKFRRVMRDKFAMNTSFCLL